jgi:hypothetical protein
MLQSILDLFNRTGILITDDPKALDQWPFPVHYCAMLKDGLTILGVVLIHEGSDESNGSPFATRGEILEPIVKHFAQALMGQKSEQQAEKLLDETNAKLLAINEIGELLGHLDLNTLLSKIVALALQMTRAEVGNLMYRESGHLVSHVEWGLTDEVINGIKWRDGSPLAQRVLEHHMPVLVEHLPTDCRFVAEESSRQIQSLVSLPLYTANKDLGVLNVVNTHGGESFSPENMATLQTVTGLASTRSRTPFCTRRPSNGNFPGAAANRRQIWEYILPRTIPAFREPPSVQKASRPAWSGETSTISSPGRKSAGTGHRRRVGQRHSRCHGDEHGQKRPAYRGSPRPRTSRSSSNSQQYSGRLHPNG